MKLKSMNATGCMCEHMAGVARLWQGWRGCGRGGEAVAGVARLWQGWRGRGRGGHEIKAMAEATAEHLPRVIDCLFLLLN